MPASAPAQPKAAQAAQGPGGGKSEKEKGKSEAKGQSEKGQSEEKVEKGKSEEKGEKGKEKGEKGKEKGEKGKEKGEKGKVATMVRLKNAEGVVLEKEKDLPVILPEAWGALSIQYPKDPKATDSPCGIEEQAKGTSTEAKVSEFPEDIEVDFCVEGELQQCEHTLTVVQSLSAERGSKNAALDTALRALNELVPAYAAKLQDKRWLLSHAAELENSSEALQLLLLADDEQNLEAAAKSGRDIPELLVAAQALAKALVCAWARTPFVCAGGCGLRMNSNHISRVLWFGPGPEHMPECEREFMPNRMSERISEYMPDSIPQRMSGRM
eukprot:s2405_g5.t1